MRYAIYILVQLVWGLPQTVAGAVSFFAYLKRPHFFYHGAIVTVWKSLAGLSLGPFVFVNSRYGPARDIADRRSREACAGGNQAERPVPKSSPVELYGIDERLLVHEYGHTVQSLILGPLYLLVIGLPSLVWMKTARLGRWRRRSRISYYSLYTERWANWLGERVLKRPSMGMAHID